MFEIQIIILQWVCHFDTHLEIEAKFKRHLTNGAQPLHNPGHNLHKTSIVAFLSTSVSFNHL